MVLELDECCNGCRTAAGEFFRHSSIRGDGDNLAGVDPADEDEGAAREVGYGDEAGVVVVVEGGVVVVEGVSAGSPFGRTGLRVGAAVLTGGSGLDRAPPDVLSFGRRRRSVEEGRFSVASSCWARLRFDFRLADLSGAGVLTGLNPLMSTRTVLLAAPPDFIVEVLIRGDCSARGESRLLPREPSMGRGFGSEGSPVATVTVVEGIRSKKAASTSGAGW